MEGSGRFFLLLACLPTTTTTMGTAGGYNGGNGAVTEGREGFPERIEIIGSNSGCTPPTYRFPSYASKNVFGLNLVLCSANESIFFQLETDVWGNRIMYTWIIFSCVQLPGHHLLPRDLLKYPSCPGCRSGNRENS